MAVTVKKTITATGKGAWQVPSDASIVKFTLIGAGGGGGGSAQYMGNNIFEGGGGGGGACLQFSLSGISGKVYEYFVGTGGAGGSNSSVGGVADTATGGTGGDGGYTYIQSGTSSYSVNGGSGGGGGKASLPENYNGSGGSGGSGVIVRGTGTIYADGGAGGAGGEAGSGYGAGGSESEAAGGGGGIGNSTIYNYAKNAGCEPYTADSVDSTTVSGSIGHYGTGGGGGKGASAAGKGGNGLIILEYSVPTTLNFTVNVTNGTVSNGSTKASKLTVSVPAGAKYERKITPAITTGTIITNIIITYDGSQIYSLTMGSDAGYGSSEWSSTSGTINSDTTVTVKYSKVQYSGTVNLGSNYKNFIINGITYTANTNIYYYYGDSFPRITWTGITSDEIVSGTNDCEMRRYVYANTSKGTINYSDTTIPSQSTDGAGSMQNSSSAIVPNPNPATRPTTYSTYYRVYVVYNANGGSATPTSTYSDWKLGQTRDIVTPINTSTTITKANYTFKGWSVDAISDTATISAGSTAAFLDSGKHTLYAVWEGNEQTITAKVTMVSDEVKYGDSLNPRIHYNLDGSDNFPWTKWINSDSESTISLRYGSKFYCENVGKAGTCYTSVKWTKDGSTIDYVDSGYKTGTQTVTKDTTVIFTPTPYTLTLTLNKNDGGGTATTVSGTHYVRSDIKLPTYESLGWSGHKDDDSAVFLGWSADATATYPTYEDEGTYSDYYSSDSSNITVPLYAVWGHIVQVEFYKDDISGVHIDTIPTDPKTGKLTRSPTDLSNIGELEFKGWISTAWSGELKSADVASIKFDNTKSGTVYVYGKWSRLKYYPITFVTSKNVAYSIPDNTCTEWKNDITYKTKDESVIFNPFTNTSAKWQQYQSSYNITYDYDKELKFSKINNVFYEVSAPSYNDGDIHMAVSCGKVGTIDLGTIQDISDSYSAILTTIPVVPLGYSGTFCMDTGVQRSLSVSVVRVSPVNPIDNSEATDSTQWSNAKWIRTLKELMDRWQMMTDGVKLHMYVPADRVNNVPPIDNKYTGASSTKSVNAYITSMPITYTSDSVHKVSMTISFKIGTIYPEPPKLKTNEITVYKDGTSTGEIFTYPADSYSALPRCPSGIISESSELFIGWKLNGAGSIKYPGDPFKVSDVSKLYAQYVSYNGAGELVEGSGSKTISVPAGASLVTICAVGGGGAGGGTSNVPISDYSGYYSGTYVVRSGGGGGGSGQLSVRRVKLAEDTTQLHIYIGKGGQTEGANGEATVVRIGSETGKVLVRAMYGYGGGANKSGGPGGEGYNNGGSGGKWLGYKYMQAMVGSGSTNYGAAGKNYEHDAASSAGRHYRCAGGGGGGAPPMIGDISKFTGDRYGGNGVTDEDENSHRDGTYGGGGGGSGVYSVSGYNLQSYFGKGGDGYVYLIWGSES